MDFFEAQARAKKRTTRLVVLFILAVAGTIAAGYIAAILAFDQVGVYLTRADEAYWHYQATAHWPEAAPETRWWNPRLFAWVAIGTIGVVGLGSMYKWMQFSAGGGAVAESVGGRRIDPGTTELRDRRLLNVVEEMAIAAGTPVPAVYVLDDEVGINAFAAGLTTSDAVVAVTRGALDKLTRDELQGVIAHEFSHILNGDMRLNLRLAAIVFGILVIGLTGRGILWALRDSPLSGGRERNRGGVVAAMALVGISLLIIGYVGYFFGRLIQAAVSRQREFLADASAVQFTRNPSGLGGALKKIGGYALGSSLQTSKAGAIGHFFFAQAFRGGLTGLWSTHPPLVDRIRAIEPGFDGKMFQPPIVVDVTRESFVDAGLAPARRPARPVLPDTRSPQAAVAAVAAIGTLTQERIAAADTLLRSLPPRLHAAAHNSSEAPALLYGLLLHDDPAVRSQQQDLVLARQGPSVAQLLSDFEPWLRRLTVADRLPLLQLSLPALRQIPRETLPGFLDALDELVHADAAVSTFEFTLQKVLIHTLQLGHNPRQAVVQYHSFHALVPEISIALSALARASVTAQGSAEGAFACGAAQLRLVAGQLLYRADLAEDFAALDTALDKLAQASPPIKQRTLLAAAHIAGADGQIRPTEAELFRAFSAALDIPMPPLDATG